MIASGLSNVNAAAVDASGTIYTVADGTTNTLLRYAPNAGNYTLTQTGTFNRSNGVSLDRLGNVYVSDDGNGQVVDEINVSSPQTFSFGSMLVGATSSTQTATLVNIGNTNMTLTGLTYSSQNYSSAGATTCTASTVLAPAANCTVAIQFNPKTNGTLTGTLTFTDNALGVAGSTQVVNLTGYASYNLAFTMAPPTSLQTGQNAGTVKVGIENNAGTVDTTQTQTITLSVTSTNGYSQTYTAAAVAGVATFSLSSATLSYSGTYTYGATGTADNQVSATESVYPYKLAITGVVTPQTASNSSTNAVTVSIQDNSGNATTQTSPITLVVTGPNSYSQTYGPTAASASSGSVTFTTAALTATGTYTYTASSTGLTGAATTQSVVAAAAVGYTVTPATTSAVVGYPINVTVSAVDVYGNVVTTYTGTVALTSTDPGPATLPAPFALASGTATKPVTFNTQTTSGWTVTASDTSNTLPSKTSVAIQVQPLPVFTINSSAGDTSGACTNQGLAGSPTGTTTDSACTVYAAFAAVTALNNTATTSYVPVINFVPALYGQTITMAQPVSVTGNFALTGPGTGANAITLSGGGTVNFLTQTAASISTLSGLTFKQFSGGNGTVLAPTSGITNLTNDIFTSNVSTGAYGGAVLFQGAGTVNVTGSTMTNNTATNSGGAMWLAGTVTISNSTFTGNASTAASGGAFLVNGGSPTLSGNTYTSNTAKLAGGAIYTSAAASESGSTYTSNVASTYGGAIYATSTLSVASSVFNGNHSSAEGGAIFSSGALTVTGGSSSFTGNYVSNSSGSALGGALYSVVAATINGAAFFNNYALTSNGLAEGGGVFFSNSATSVTNSLFSGNYVSGTTASYGGGAGSAGKFTGVTFVGNYTAGTAANQDGGGAYLSLGTLYNVTATGNSAKSGGGIWRTSTVSAYNTVISGNTATSTYKDTNLTSSGTTGYINYSSSLTCTTSCTPMLSALGNFGGPVQTMVPLPGSPLLAAGTNTATAENNATTDGRGAGFARAVNYNGVAHTDIGAVTANYSLGFVAQPTSTTVGTMLPPPPTVQVYESGALFAPGVALGTLNIAAASGTLSSSTAAVSAAGLATISGSFSEPQSNESLMAAIASGAATPVTVATATSGLFNITDPSASSINFVTAPAYSVSNGGNAGVVKVGLYTSAGSLDTSATPTVSLAVSATGYTANYSAAAVAGVATFDLTGVPLTVNGAYQYLATASAYTADSATADETVAASVIGSFVFAGVPASATVGTSYTFTVTAKDTTGATMTSFTGPVTLTSNDATAVITPANYTFNTSDAGVHSFTVTFGTGGLRTVAATNTNVAATGSESGIEVGGYIWLTNANGTVTKLTEAGASVTGAVGISGSTSVYGGVSFDSTGGVWSVTSANNFLNYVTKTGASAATYSGGGLNLPASVAVDGSGMVWVANSGNNSVSIFTNAGVAQSASTGDAGNALHAPSAIAIDSTGSVWVTNRSTSTVTRIFGAAAPIVTPLATGVANGTTGVKP